MEPSKLMQPRSREGFVSDSKQMTLEMRKMAPVTAVKEEEAMLMLMFVLEERVMSWIVIVQSD